MKQINYNHDSQFRIASSRTFIEYLDEETKTWHRYTDQDMGYVIYLNQWNIISSNGWYINEPTNPLVWELVSHGDVFEEWENEEDETTPYRQICEHDLEPLVSVAHTMEQIQKLPLIRMFSDALRRHDLPQFTFCLLAWLDYRMLEFNLDILVKKAATSGLVTELRENMSEEDRHKATCELLKDIIFLARAINESHFDMFSTEKYLALLVTDFPFLKEIQFSEYHKVARGMFRSNCSRYDDKVDVINSGREVEFPNRSIREKLATDGLLESDYNSMLYRKSPVFVKEAIYLPELFESYQKRHNGAWRLVSGNQEIDALLAEAWRDHDIILLVWWFCIASQIKSGKIHFNDKDVRAGKRGDIQWMYNKLLEWDEWEELWFDPQDMPFWPSRCIKELTFLAEDALEFFGAKEF